MRNIDSFIVHVVNNLFPLNEYSEGEIKRLMDQFKEEADDLNIDISDANLEAAIKRFDQLKNSPKITEKDLRKYNLAKLLKITGSSEGAEAPATEEETGPDVAYSENGYTIFSGGNEELCQRHRNDVPWCITRTSFGNYRYSKDRNYPSFYLVKNANLPDSDPLSFVAIQVRSNGNYVFTNRDNRPHESREMSWETLNSNIPWLRDIPNAKSLLRYVPLSSKEKLTQLYSKEAISIRKWETLPFSEKKQYLVIRKGYTDLFSDIDKNEFVEKYLPNYPQLATFITTNADIIDPTILLKHLDKFSVNDRKSITANLREKINIDELDQNNIPFDVKKLLVKLDKWETEPNERIYITSDNNAIVKLTFKENDIQVGVFTDERDYPSIKLNSRTAKYLTEYPDLDKLSLPTVLKLVDKEVVNADFVNKILEKAQADPDSAIAVKDTDTGKIILDSNSFTSYKVENGKLKSIPFSSEEVQNVLKSETENTGFQTSAVNLVFGDKDLPNNIDKDSFVAILNSTPYAQRTGTTRNTANAVILVNPQAEVGSGNKTIFTIPSSIDNIPTSTITDYGRLDSWNTYDYNNSMGIQDWTTTIQYYKDTNQKFTDGKIRTFLSNLRDYDRAKDLVQMDLPMADGSTLKPVVVGDNVLLVNTTDPRSSYIVSSRSGKVLNKVIPATLARQILGRAAAPATQTTEPTARRGRPRQATAPATPTAAGANTAVATTIENAGLTTGFNSLPNSIKTRISAGTVTPYTRRNAAIDAIGTVVRLISAGQSRFYIIRRPSGRVIGFATMQPDAKHFIVTGNTSYRIPRVSALANVLQIQGLNEATKTLIKLHAVAMPEKINEMKELLKSLKNKKK